MQARIAFRFECRFDIFDVAQAHAGEYLMFAALKRLQHRARFCFVARLAQDFAAMPHNCIGGQNQGISCICTIGKNAVRGFEARQSFDIKRGRGFVFGCRRGFVERACGLNEGNAQCLQNVRAARRLGSEEKARKIQKRAVGNQNESWCPEWDSNPH